MNHFELSSVVREAPRTVTRQPVSMPMLASTKLQTCHLSKRAIVYVRQSTPQQVIDHRESTERQYALVDRAVALGWSREQVIVIDEDQGQSGQSAEGRLGFQRMLAEIGLDHVAGDLPRHRIAGEGVRRAAPQVAGELVEEQQQGQTALRGRHPGVILAPGRGEMYRLESQANGLVEPVVLAEPLARPGLPPESDDVDGCSAHATRLAPLAVSFNYGSGSRAHPVNQGQVGDRRWSGSRSIR